MQFTNQQRPSRAEPRMYRQAAKRRSGSRPMVARPERTCCNYTTTYVKKRGWRSLKPTICPTTASTVGRKRLLLLLRIFATHVAMRVTI